MCFCAFLFVCFFPCEPQNCVVGCVEACNRSWWCCAFPPVQSLPFPLVTVVTCFGSRFRPTNSPLLRVIQPCWSDFHWSQQADDPRCPRSFPLPGRNFACLERTSNSLDDRVSEACTNALSWISLNLDVTCVRNQNLPEVWLAQHNATGSIQFFRLLDSSFESF